MKVLCTCTPYALDRQTRASVVENTYSLSGLVKESLFITVLECFNGIEVDNGASYRTMRCARSGGHGTDCVARDATRTHKLLSERVPAGQTCI